MYPKKQTKYDTKQGLISQRPDWFKNKAEISGFDFEKETYGEARFRSIEQEIEELNGTLILNETLNKPTFNNGEQEYSENDWLKPILKEIFKDNPDPNRFSHTHDDWTNKIIPKVEELIKKTFQDKNLFIPNFKIILTPALIANLKTTLFQPQDSKTNIWEWYSTALKDINNKDTGQCLDGGDSDNGGAADVNHSSRSNSNNDLGGRLSVMFFKNTEN
jgi:hypothetical protein